jgi:hypothetical protein
MVTSILQKLVFGTASAALVFTVLKASPTIAAIVSYDFTVDIDYGSLQGNQYNGFFRYQDESIPSNLTGRLFDIITEFEFNFVNSDGLPTTYSADDAFFTSAYFSNGLFEGLSIEAEVNNVFFEFESEPVVLDEFLYTIYPLPTTQFGGGSVTYNRTEEPATSVPEPVASFGLCILGMGFLLKKVSTQGKIKKCYKSI